MWPFPIRWDKIKDKEGDSINVSLTPVQRDLLIAAVMNVQYVGEKAPQSMKIEDSDTDNFDAVVSDLQSKLAGV